MKKNILSFILGAIIFGSISVVSAYTLLASNTGYTPSDETWDVDNVKDALDNLHTKAVELDNNRGKFTNASVPTASSVDDRRIISSSYNVESNEPAYHAFDNVPSTFWTSDPYSTLPQYIGWDLEEVGAVYNFSITNRTNVIDTTVGNFILQGSFDGENWDDIQSFTHTNKSMGGKVTYNVDNPQYFIKYRLKITSEGVKNAHYVQISQLDFNYIKPYR